MSDLNLGATNAIDAYVTKIIREARADERRRTLAAARAACERQTMLASLVAGRPTDFEKGIMSCVAAIQALAEEGQ